MECIEYIKEIEEVSRNRKGKLDKISIEELSKIVASSISCADALRKLGYKCTTGGAHSLLKKKIAKLNLDISHWVRYPTRKNELSLFEVFQNDSPRGGHILKKKIIKFDILPYRCAICGNEGIWNDMELTLQLDHINGNHNDNRVENLRFLCPNCHSQTLTFGGKNIVKFK